MSDLAQELAALVADTLAAADSWRSTGAFLAPTGALPGLPAAEPWPAGPSRPPPSRAEAPRAEAPRAVASARPAEAPRPAPSARPPEAPRPAAPAARPVPPAVRPAPAARPPEPPPRPVVERPALLAPAAAEGAPAGAGFAGLFGAKWQQALRDPAAEISQLVESAGACPSCGAEALSLRGTGTAEARLAVVAAGPGGRRLVGDAGVMFDKMLMHVLALERADVWLFEANACAAEEGAGTCRGLLVRQLEIAAPRLVLAMGPAATRIVGVSAGRGEWGRVRDADVLATFHPEELLARPAEKRPAMEHLTALRQRL